MRFRYWVLIAAGIFAVGIAAGAVVAIVMPAGITKVLADQFVALQELGTALGPFHASTAVFIFLKNASAILISFLFSPLLCLLPLLALLFNSALIAFIAPIVIEQKSVWFFLGGLLPHGVFEIPAFIIGEAVALSFGVTTLVAIFTGRGSDYWLGNLRKNLKYLLLALVLLVPGAVIETFVTPLLLR
ncbi:MAG: stage II sporulation protein M [Chloroflexota bacterium]